MLCMLLLALASNIFGRGVELSNVNFIDFVNNVSSGANYSGDTVYLCSDITLTGKIDSIGNDTSNYFLGVFDGQGHTISNLQMNSSSYYTGLFGYSTGLTIRNIVLDSSCSISSASSGPNGVYVGGIIGRCEAYGGECFIEGSVNMAGVTFSGSTSNNLWIGGIVGSLYSPDYDAHVKNCVNYGSVIDPGTVCGLAVLGGIVGFSAGSSRKYVQNCLNYGTIIHNGTPTDLTIGGIVGNSVFTYIENCVSAGKITTPTTASSNNRIGSIIGQAGSNAYINYCYYTSDVNVSSINGYGTPSSTTGSSNSSTDMNPELVIKLNANATSCNWNKWLMLHLNGGSINNLKQELFAEIQGHIPDPAKEGNSFLFWCKDAECTEEFDPKTETVSEITDLYAGWTPNNYTVTFDFGNGTTVNVTFTYNTEIIYPENSSILKEGYTLSWDNYHETMPAKDITIIVQWTPNNYTVTFDANGGNVSETSKIVTFNEKYGNLPEPNRTGYIFIGWFDEKNENVTNEKIIIIPKNHTLCAHWEEVTNQVEIAFRKKRFNKRRSQEHR